MSLNVEIECLHLQGEGVDGIHLIKVFMMKLSALALATGLAFSASAFAAENVWDSATPWGDATVVDYAEWNAFGWTSITSTQSIDATPDVAGAGSLAVTGAATITGTQNIYSWQTPLAYTATLASSATGMFDVYLRAASMGLTAATTAYLNGVAATAVETHNISMGIMFGEPAAQREYYFVWNNVSAADLYTFTWADTRPHVSLDQLALATVAVAAVPEPSTYGMLALGLGVLAFAGRRSRKNAA